MLGTLKWFFVLVLLLSFFASPVALGCQAIDGTIPPWGGSGPNGLMAEKVQTAYAAAAKGGGQAPPSPPISGTHPAVMILIENSGAGAAFNPSFSNAALWSTRLTEIDNYYDEVSGGLFGISPAAETHGTANDGVIGPVTVSGLSSTSDIQFGGASIPLAVAAVQAANPFINFAAYDTDSSGTIEADELHILIYQAGDEASYFTSATPRAWAHMTWQTPVLSGLNPATDSDGKNITSYNYCGSEFNGIVMATQGPMTHELGHDIGLPDLYDADGTGSGGNWSGLGAHCLMAGGSWGGNLGDSPVHPNGFLKVWLGWATAATYTAPVDFAFNLSTTDVVRVDIPGSQQFFIIENRQQTGFDAGLPGTLGGLAIYHCDGAILTDNNIRVSNNVNKNPVDFGIKLEQADGSDSLSSPSASGSHNDYFRSGNNVTFNAGSNPNSNLKNSSASNVDVNTIGASQAVMSFNIGFPIAVSGTNPSLWNVFR